MLRTGFRAWAQYQFDKSMARGTPALVGWLALAAILIVATAAALVALVQIRPDGEPPYNFFEGLWASLMRTLDPGTMGQDRGWAFRLVMLLVTLTGIFLVSTLIGVLSSGIQTRLGQLRKGRSFVLEQGHTIIFNWSPSVFDVVSELIAAGEPGRKRCIVLMSNRDKAFMEDEMRQKVPRRRATIICRSGDPTDLQDLAIVNPQAAATIIILAPEEEGGDSCVIKTILALVHDPNRREARYRIVAELRESKSAELARVVGGPEVQLVLADDLISRILVQACRQPGLSTVYTELLSFSGSEIYTVQQPEIEGMSFGDALLAYETSSLIGLEESDGRVWLNPAMDTIVAPGMKAIVIAEDDGPIAVRPTPARRERRVSDVAPPLPRGAERSLLLGWNHRGPAVAAELSRYVSPGSSLLVAADTPGIEEELRRVVLPTGNLSLDFRRVDTGRRDEILALDPATFDHVLVLGCSDHLSAQAADTKTLVTLLHLRAIIKDSGAPVSIVSEMIDVRNRALGEVARVDDFVVSNKVVSSMLAQVSENSSLEAVFADLLDEEGSEICLRSAREYVQVGQALAFRDVVEAACLRGEVAIGHHLVGGDAAAPAGIRLNPAKSDPVRYGPADRIIVVARC